MDSVVVKYNSVVIHCGLVEVCSSLKDLLWIRVRAKINLNPKP